MANLANHEFDEYIESWDQNCSDYEVRWIDETNDYTGDDVEFHDISLSELLEQLGDNPMLEYRQAEIWAIDADGGVDENDGAILFWDGNAWDFDRM